jgi:non-specific serine/threonine protein kinase
MGEAANAVQLKLGRQRYEEAWAAGGGLSLDQAMIEALSPESQRTGDVQRHGPLTAREWEVAQLVADGFTNRRIGDALVITEGTAALHVRHVLNKLGFDTRAQIAAWVTTRR